MAHRLSAPRSHAMLCYAMLCHALHTPLIFLLLILFLHRIASHYKVVLTDGTSTVGSIAAGGRYDNLVGMFSPSSTQTPCVGVSIGIERVFTIMERRAAETLAAQASQMQVFIASIGPDLITERMKIAKLLWGANVACEYSHLDNPKLKKQVCFWYWFVCVCVCLCVFVLKCVDVNL
jgi:hypothetical protein